MKTNLINMLTISFVAFLMIACSGGGSSGSVGNSNNNVHTLSWIQSTVEASKAYMKSGDSITVTVTVRDTDGELMDLDRDFQVAPLCSGCLNAMPNLSVTDFSLVSKGVYTYTLIAQDTSEVSFMLIYYGGSQGPPSDTVPNQPKLSLRAYGTCDASAPGVGFRQVTNGGVTYNAICDATDLRRIRTSNASVGAQNFVLLADIANDGNGAYLIYWDAAPSTQFTGIFDGNSKKVTGTLLFNITNGATIKNLTVEQGDDYLVGWSFNTTLNNVKATNVKQAKAARISSCQGSTTLTNSPTISCEVQ